MKQIIKLVAALGLFSLVAGWGLSAVYDMTKDPIAAQNKLVEDAAKKEVLPEAVSFEDAKLNTESLCAYPDYWIGKDASGAVVGYVAKVHKQGYSSDIKTIVGIKIDGSITAIKIIEQSETPGLGTKCQEIALDKNTQKPVVWFQEQYKNLKAGIIEVIKGPVPPGVNGISAITASTISSKAITDSINIGIKDIMADIAAKMPVEDKKEGTK